MKPRLFFALIAGLGALGASAAPLAQTTPNVAYQYDALGRLTQATYASGLVIKYAYDAVGNRTQTTVSGGPAHAPVMVLPLLGGLVLPVKSAS